MTHLKQHNRLVDLQILDNEVSADYKATMPDIRKVDYQLVPPNLQCHNAAERANRTFKAPLLSILVVIAEYSPKTMWDLLIPQTKITLNLLRQSTLESAIYAWEYFNGPISNIHAPLVPLSYKIVMHKKPNARPSWDFHEKDR